ncbi:MAG: c-type cytochrome [Rhizobiales bacterium]|nr:c-type cytochrome [Hyphomicrobiales bacterium]
MKSLRLGPVMFALALWAPPGFADQELARTNGCFQCHKPGNAGVGPSFAEIAAKYRGNEAARASLIVAVKAGSKGNWTALSKGVPMPPFSPRISDGDIERLVDWIKGL